MKKVTKIVMSMILVVAMTMSLITCSFAATAKTGAVRVGVGKGDITGPITEISTGYNSLGDLMKGLLMRSNARAFIIETNGAPMVYVSAEIVHMTESIKPGVLKELQKRGLSKYTEENCMIAATHAHCSSSNVSWYALYDLINGVPGYDADSYEIIVQGIADAIEQADKNLSAGSVKLAYGDVKVDSYNRSLGAAKYNVNYDGSKYVNDFDAAYKTVSHEMQLLTFYQGGKEVGMLSFYASHGTSCPITNTLVSADHKGYAAYTVEKAKGGNYVAAFAQSECGDVSPNKPHEDDVTEAFQRPQDINKSLDMIENEIVAGQQEADAALKLQKGGKGVTTIDLSKNAALDYEVVDFANIAVDKKYIGEYHMPYDDIDNAKTSQPCIGAGIIAGDEEGAPVDNALEGDVKNKIYLDEDGNKVFEKYDFKTIDLFGLESIAPVIWEPIMTVLKSNKYDDAQAEKLVCLDVGSEGLITFMEEETPLQIFQIGEVALAASPFEVTTEQGKRIKAQLEKTLAKKGVKCVIMACYSNAYSQYLTTREEYAAQHYEGATNLFGPWAGAALTQEFDKLASNIANGKRSTSTAKMRTEKPAILLETPVSLLGATIDSNNPGTLVTDVKKSYKVGQKVKAEFEAANPRTITELKLADNEILPANYTYLKVQKLVNGKWKTVRTDADPYTYIRYDVPLLGLGDFNCTVVWLTKGADKGTYRLAYKGIAKTGVNSYKKVTGVSSSFVLK